MGRGPQRIWIALLLTACIGLAAARAAADVRPLGHTLQLTHSHVEGPGGPGNPTVAYDPARHGYLVVWQAPSGRLRVQQRNSSALFARRFDAHGRARGGVVLVAPSSAHPTEPQVSFNPRSRRYFVAWRLSQGARMAGRALDARGKLLGPIRRLPSFQPAGGIQSLAFPVFDLDPNPVSRGWLLTWDVGPGGVLVRGVDPSGRMPGRSLLVSPPGELAQAPTSTANGADGEFLVTWTVGHDNYGHAVRARRVAAASGALLGAAFDVSHSDPKSRLERPAVAFNRVAGRYLAVWKDVPTKRYVGAEVGPEGVLGGEELLSSSEHSFPSGPPALAAIPSSPTFLLGYVRKGVPLASIVGLGGVERGPFEVAPPPRGLPRAYGDVSQVTLTNGGPRRILAVWSGRRARRHDERTPRQVYAHMLRVVP